MSSVAKVIRSVGPKLVPFFKTVAIYFVIFIPQDKPSIFSVILKCLPIVSLMLFVILNGMSLGNEYKYSRKILLGLIFCCIGDALLVWNQYFDLGMLAFMIGHLQYIMAFGFKPLQVPLATVLFTLGTMVVFYLLPDLYGVFSFGVPIYIFIITTMLWRAIARVQLFEDLWTWSKLCTCAGGILFALSDLLIGIDRFKFNIEYAQVLVMSTYYAGQFGIAVSVVDATAPINLEKNKKA
ncbi:lysoplasmalogenase-like protein TMEM86A isoform X1 [Diabrotica virgifera virgifera]|uniref:lysoplasmalogenase n=1 Tax=Diabrotica virgifera virgifera TaxID=50390 RepID=A0ABM5IWT2_DIAVI|nr:lysoplasmalogenase-like protein TMEM86A isoform X1 [Diabrotica virgifera virgifera]